MADERAVMLLEEAKAAGRLAADAQTRVDAAIESRLRGMGVGPTDEELRAALALSGAAHACWRRYADHVSQAIEMSRLSASIQQPISPPLF
jgi:hypothetical protein